MMLWRSELQSANHPSYILSLIPTYTTEQFKPNTRPRHQALPYPHTSLIPCSGGLFIFVRHRSAADLGVGVCFMLQRQGLLRSMLHHAVVVLFVSRHLDLYKPSFLAKTLKIQYSLLSSKSNQSHQHNIILIFPFHNSSDVVLFLPQLTGHFPPHYTSPQTWRSNPYL